MIPIDSQNEFAPLADELGLLDECAEQAAKIALSYYKKDPDVWMKPGDSPVSEGDLAVDKFLKETLGRARPDYGWLSEETSDDLARMSAKRCFVVDPIDGTRAYIAGRETWCISIAIVENGRPIAGILNCPILEEIYTATSGGGAFLNSKPISAVVDNTDLPIALPRSVNDKERSELVGDHPIWPNYIPSLAYRLVMVANGTLRAAYTKPRSYDWDIVASDLILAESGGSLLDYNYEKSRSDLQPSYNGENIRHGVLLAHAQNAPQSLFDAADKLAGAEYGSA